MPKLITGVGCPYCGSSCDDLEVLVSDDETKILEVHNACIIGSNLFHHANDPTRPRLPRQRQPDGSMKEIPYDEAIDYIGKDPARSQRSPSSTASAPPTARA